MKDLKLNCSVNSRTQIKSLETKANAAGFKWIIPHKFEPSIETHTDNKTGQQYQIQKDFITINDFDGEKKTIKTEYVFEDGSEYKSTEYGVYNNHLASNYYGKNSRNFKPQTLTTTEIIRTLHYGHSISPGLHDPKNDKERGSWRSINSLVNVQFILFDGDRWEEVEAPNSYDDLSDQYPDIENDFFYVGESISSRSDLKPELRFRFGLIFPEAIRCKFIFDEIVNHYCEKYKFLDPRVATDLSRLSFGNGRIDILEKQFDSIMPQELFDSLKDKGSKKKHKSNIDKLNKEKRQQDRQDYNKREKELISKGLLAKPKYDYKDLNPWKVFCETVDVAGELINQGLITDIGNGFYNWHESGQGVSLEITNEGVVKIFSTSPKAYLPPSHDSDSPINGHRFIAYILYEIDIKGSSKFERRELYRKLADDGYGTYTDPKEFARRKREIDIAEAKLKKEQALDIKRAESRLKVDKHQEKELKESLTSITVNQDRILEFLESDKEILGLISETGAGKTEQALRNQDQKTFCVPTIELAHEIQNRSEVMGKDAMVWKARNYGYEQYAEKYPTFDDRVDHAFEDGTVCIQADICNKYATKGGEVRSLICPQCPVFEECKAKGYLSQLPILKETDIQILAIQDLFTDPEWEGWADELLSQEDEDSDDLEIGFTDKVPEPKEVDQRTAIIDEAKGHNFFIECKLTKSRLEDIATMWHGKEAGNIVDSILENFDDPEAIKESIMQLKPREISKINKQLGRLRLPISEIENRTYHEPGTDPNLAQYNLRIKVTGIDDVNIFRVKDDDTYEYICESDSQTAVIPPMDVGQDYLELSIAQAVKGRIFRLDDEMEYMRMPPVEKNSKFTFINKLIRCFEYYNQIPMTVEDDVLIFYCPPVKHKKLNKLIAMSATLNGEHLHRAFPDTDIEVMQTFPTPFADGAELYQIDTGKYTANSLLEPDKNQFTRTGLTFLKEIEKKIASDTDNSYAIITSKRIIELRKKVWESLPNPPITANFGAASGMDTKYHDVDRIIVLGSFEIPPPEIMLRSKILYGNDDQELSDERQSDHLNNMQYIDERVRSVYESQTIGELIQCIGRARLNREAKKVYLFSGHYIPNYTERSIKFDATDLQIANTFDNLKEVSTIYRTYKEAVDAKENKQYAMAEDLFWANRGNISIHEVVKRTGLTRYKVSKIYKEKIKPSLSKDNNNIDQLIKQELKNGLAKKTIMDLYDVSRSQIDKTGVKKKSVDKLILEYMEPNKVYTLATLVKNVSSSRALIQKNITLLVGAKKVIKPSKGKYKLK